MSFNQTVARFSNERRVALFVNCPIYFHFDIILGWVNPRPGDGNWARMKEDRKNGNEMRSSKVSNPVTEPTD